MVTGCGAVLMGIVYSYMRYVPTYEVSMTEVPESGLFDGFSPTEPLRRTSGIAATITSAEDFLQNLLIASIGALGLLALIGASVGWVVAGRIVRPLAVINHAAQRAASGQLDHRVALAGPRDEVRDLADTFDDMLQSLGQAFDTHKWFAANASHELQTPLATTKTMIDVALADPSPTMPEMRALLQRLAAVNQASSETVHALLDLTSIANTPPRRERIGLRNAVEEVISEVHDEAGRRQVQVRPVVGEGWVCGDAVLLRQALSNLLRNAVRHNLPQGYVEVCLRQVGRTVTITIENSGQELTAATVANLTEPFVRGAGRTLTRGSGHGLGLAIVSAVVNAHRGALRIAPRPRGGLVVTMNLHTPVA
jgi:two-component system sensor histidine kinase VanS